MPRCKVKKPALRFFASKFRFAFWIVSNFAAHSTYVEEFSYGASLLLFKTPSDLEVINNVNEDVSNFFQVLRERRDELVAALEMTPYSRREFLRAWLPTDDPLEGARRLYVRSWQGRSPASTTSASPTAWRYQKSGRPRGAGVVEDWNHLDHLLFMADRLKRVEIECDDWSAVFARYDSPDALHYIAHPCVRKAKSQSWGDGSTKHRLSLKEHEDIAAAAHGARGKVVVSGYPSDLYASLYRDWNMVTTSAGVDRGTCATEALWLSPSASREIEPLLPFDRPDLLTHARGAGAVRQCA